MRMFLLCVLLASGCDPIWNLSVTVRSPANQPVQDAALVLTGCPDQDTHDLGTVAAMTDSNGEASVGGLGTEYPKTCAITVAKPGFRSHQSSFAELCKGDTSNCDRTQHVDVVLEPTAP